MISLPQSRLPRSFFFLLYLFYSCIPYLFLFFFFFKATLGTSWLHASNAGDVGLIPGWGSKIRHATRCYKKKFFLRNFKKCKKTTFKFSKKALKLSCDSGFPWFCCDIQDKWGFFTSDLKHPDCGWTFSSWGPLGKTPALFLRVWNKLDHSQSDSLGEKEKLTRILFLSCRSMGRSEHIRDMLFVFLFWLGHMAFGILVPPPGIEPRPWQWKHRVLTTEAPGIPRNVIKYICKGNIHIWNHVF